ASHQPCDMVGFPESQDGLLVGSGDAEATPVRVGDLCREEALELTRGDGDRSVIPVEPHATVPRRVDGWGQRVAGGVADHGAVHQQRPVLAWHHSWKRATLA